MSAIEKFGLSQETLVACETLQRIIGVSRHFALSLCVFLRRTRRKMTRREFLKGSGFNCVVRPLKTRDDPALNTGDPGPSVIDVQEEKTVRSGNHGAMRRFYSEVRWSCAEAD